MEVALVSAATGVLKPVLEKLAALLGDKYKHFKGMCKEIESLTRELVAMDAFLLKMSEEEDPDVQNKIWMNEVRELSYDMEDCIDDFMQSLHDKDTKPHGFIEKIKHSLGKMKARRRIGKEIHDLKKQIIEVSERNERYNTRQSFCNTKNANVDPRALAIFEHASTHVGIDEPKAEIVKLLSKEDGCVSTEEQLRVVAIVGSGGMGKTTLANQVYQELKGQFKCRLFLSVSRNPDLMNILRTILSEVSGQGYASTKSGSIQQLIIKINNSLLEKRYFIVIDDIWDVDTWNIIKQSFPVTGYGKDSIIKRKDLIRRWIGEGFIHKNGRYTVHEIGERCFNELLNRSLIQPVKINEYGEVRTCRIHDTILDFIISKSIEENFITLLSVPILTIGTQSKVIRRFSLQVGKQGDSTIPIEGQVLSHVRSFNVFWSYMEIPSLEKFRHLRVLYLKHCYQLEEHHLENIVSLFQLRYLNLNKTRIKKLPEQIGRLGCLETLELRGTNVKELPTSIINLGNLAHIHVDLAVKFPDGILKMQALETVKDIFVSKQPFHFLWGLGELQNLRHLALHFQGKGGNKNLVQENGEDWNKAIISSLCKLGTQNLRSLTIWEGSNFLQEHLCMRTLEKLITWYSPVQRVPKWLSSLVNLRQLRLQVDGIKQHDLCLLGGLPALLILHLMETTGSSGKLRISGATGFRFLRNFNYDAYCHPVDLMFAAGSMPKLEKLVLIRLVVAEAEALHIGIENLPCLITVECEVIGNGVIIEAVKTAMERIARTHPIHPTLIFRRLRI